MTKYAVGTPGNNRYAGSNIVWFSTNVGAMAEIMQFGVSPAYVQAYLLLTTDGGATWTRLNDSVCNTAGYWADPSSIYQNMLNGVPLTKDSSNNLYVISRTRYIKWSKGSGNTWTGAMTTQSGVDTDSLGAMMITTATDAHTLFWATPDASLHIGSITLMKTTRSAAGVWTTTIVQASDDPSGVYAVYYKAVTLIAGVPQMIYGVNDTVNGTVTLYPSSIMQHASWPYTTAQNAEIGHLQVVTTNNGYVHIVYSYAAQGSDPQKIYHNIWNGSSWGTPVEVGTAKTNYNYIGYRAGDRYSIYVGFNGMHSNNWLNNWTGGMVLSTDGTGLFLFWPETEAWADSFYVRSTTWNGVTWSAIVDEETGLPPTVDSQPNVAVIGGYGGQNQGIGTAVIYNKADGTLVKVYARTNSYPPYAPTLTSMIGGIATSSLTPTLTWTFSDPTPSDSQSAYQVQVIRASDSVVIWDSGKITSTTSSATVPGSTLSYGVNYQWKVRTYDQSNQAGPYSSLGLFKTSQPPTATITVPADEEVIVTDSPTIEWTYSDSESTPQNAYQVRIADSLGNIYYDSGVVSSAGVSHPIPVGILINGGEYIIQVRVRDSDLIWSTYAQNDFTVEFVSPTQPILSVTQDDAGIATLAFEMQPPVINAWNTDAFKIYRKTPDMADFELVGEMVHVAQLVVDELEATADWTAAGNATSAILSAGKVGINSLGLGLSGAGDGTYTKTTLTAPEWNVYDRLQAWFYVDDPATISDVTIRFGQDSSNYFEYTLAADSMEATSWVPIDVAINDCTITGSPNRSNLTYFQIRINGGTGAISAGDLRFDHIRFVTSTYTYVDYTTAAGNTYTYAVSAYNIPQNIESPRAIADPIDVEFKEQYINTYLIPLDNPEAYVKGFMDGSKPPAWIDRTETQYYYPKGSSKPIVVVNGVQQFKEGTVEMRFFDQAHFGQGLPSVDQLEFIKNYKPILFRTWWGRNYIISIDGDVTTQRNPGIGWYSAFSFKEINE